ncbi:hypothetical protein [Alicyclobacillus suci]|nr:hypothetical protein [Alicyclobacillus suci]
MLVYLTRIKTPESHTRELDADIVAEYLKAKGGESVQFADYRRPT